MRCQEQSHLPHLAGTHYYTAGGNKRNRTRRAEKYSTVQGDRAEKSKRRL